MSYQQEKFKEIADAIREKTDTKRDATHKQGGSLSPGGACRQCRK